MSCVAACILNNLHGLDYWQTATINRAWFQSCALHVHVLSEEQLQTLQTFWIACSRIEHLEIYRTVCDLAAVIKCLPALHKLELPFGTDQSAIPARISVLPVVLDHDHFHETVQHTFINDMNVFSIPDSMSQDLCRITMIRFDHLHWHSNEVNCGSLGGVVQQT